MLENTIDQYFSEKLTLSKEELVDAIQRLHPSLAVDSITVYLSKLKKEGLIRNPSRGYYSISNKAIFEPEIDAPLKKIYRKIKTDFPFINFCVWNTKWLNDLMRHQPFKNYNLIEVEKDAAEQVFYKISEHHKNVYFNPSEEIFERYIANSNQDPLIVKYLVSESPLNKIDQLEIPSLEKILIDILADENLFAAQQSELKNIYHNAFDKYEVNVPKMKRYAIRRNKEQEVVNILSLILAK